VTSRIFLSFGRTLLGEGTASFDASGGLLGRALHSAGGHDISELPVAAEHYLHLISKTGRDWPYKRVIRIAFLPLFDPPHVHTHAPSIVTPKSAAQHAM
jgi:hypothetical protein